MIRMSVVCVLFAMLSVACDKTEGGECGDQLSEERQWYFLTQSSPGGNLEQCVVCNFSLPPDEVADWIRDNAGNDFLSSGPDLSGALPCVYVYGPGPYDSESACQALSCSNDPDTNDAVYSDQHAGRAILEKRGQ
jgi:hypothetical protein